MYIIDGTHRMKFCNYPITVVELKSSESVTLLLYPKVTI